MRALLLRHRALARVLVLTAVVLGVVAGSAASAGAAGSQTVIDSFTSGAGSWQTCGNSLFVYQQDASILGGARELALRDGGSCHFGPFPAQMSIDVANGTASWGGPSTYAPEQYFSYGTEIGKNASYSWSPSPNGSKGTPLNLSLSLTDEIVIQMAQVHGTYMNVRLRGGNGQTYSAAVPGGLAVGTNLVPLSSFPGLTAAAASDIDGISFAGSNKNPVDVVSEFAIKAGDGDPPVDAPTATPAANAAGWNNSDVTVDWNWTDSGSGIDASNCTQSSSSTGEGAIELDSSCSDNAGNSASDSLTVNVDETAPVVSYTGGGTYTVDQDVAITCSSSDALSGVASDTCTDVSGPAWSLGLGSHDLSATATDNADNTGSGSTSYTVTVDATSLCTLVTRWAKNAGQANSLCVKLNAAAAAEARGQAKTAQNTIDAFDSEVRAQSGKGFTAAQAALLVQFASAL